MRIAFLVIPGIFDDLFHALMAGIIVGNRTDDIVKTEVISHTLLVDVFVDNQAPIDNVWIEEPLRDSIMVYLVKYETFRRKRT